MENQKSEKRRNRLLKLTTDNELALFDHVNELEDVIEEKTQAIDQKITTLIEEVKKKEAEDITFEIDRETIRGLPGEDYVLTDTDKQEIAMLAVMDLEVPVVEKVVERVIEKTEVIKEQPIITEVTKFVENNETAIETRDKLESLKEDSRLDISAIRGWKKLLSNLTDDIINRAIGILDQRTSFLINKVSNLQNQVNNQSTASGGFTIETPTPVVAVNGSVTVFTGTVAPVYIVADGTTYFNGAGYTLAGTVATMDNGPTQYIRFFHT